MTLARMAPPALLAWPPVARLLATRPGFRDAVGLRHVVLALVAEAMGDRLAWPELVRLLSAGGFLLPGDPPRPALLAPLDLEAAGVVRAPQKAPSSARDAA